VVTEKYNYTAHDHLGNKVTGSVYATSNLDAWHHLNARPPCGLSHVSTVLAATEDVSSLPDKSPSYWPMMRNGILAAYLTGIVTGLIIAAILFMMLGAS